MDLEGKKVIIKFEEKLYKHLYNFLLQNQMEQISYIFCHTSITGSSIVILPKKIILFENNEAILKKHSARVWVDTDGVNEVYYRFINSDYTCMINCHSHPFDKGDVWFSSVDDASDRNEFEYFCSEIKKGKNIKQKDDNILPVSMVWGVNTIAVRTFSERKKSFVPLDQVVVLSEPIRYITPVNRMKNGWCNSSIFPGTVFCQKYAFDYKEIFNRQILAFGEEGQKVLSGLTVSIIGLGGIGSILGEGLCRLGIRRFILVDHDKLELSNMNRWQGAEFNDNNRYKVDVAGEKLGKMFPDVTVTGFKTTLFDELAVKSIKNSDCIIGCLDNHETRYFLNRISLQYLIPFIDGSTIIESESGKVIGLKVKLSIVLPGKTRCMDCSEIKYYDIKKVREFFLDAETRRNLQRGGYIKGNNDITAPAVYPLNMHIASLMLVEFLNIFTGFKPVSWNICTDVLNLDSAERKHLDTKQYLEEPTGRCLVCEDYKAAGDSEKLDYFLYYDREIDLPGD